MNVFLMIQVSGESGQFLAKKLYGQRITLDYFGFRSIEIYRSENIQPSLGLDDEGARAFSQGVGKG